jgi:PAS domain S-box-containing protein
MQKKESNKVFNPETLYKKLVKNMEEAVWVGDKNERTIYANPKFCQMMEMPIEDMLGKLSYDFWDEESAKLVKQINETKRKQGIRSNYEGVLKTKSNKKIPVFLRGTPLTDGGTTGIMTDLTEIKQRDSLYKVLVENMNEAVWMGNKQEVTIFVNPKFSALTGYTLDEVKGKPSYFFWDKESGKKIRQENKEKRTKGLRSTYEGNIVTKNKEIVPVLVSGTPLPDGGTIGIITDLSELKKITRQEKILNTAIKYASNAIIIFNKNQEILSWNNGAEIIFGHKEEQIIGKKIDTLFSMKDINQIIGTPRILYNIQLKGNHKNKRQLDISATLTPINTEKNTEADYFLLIARDITNQIKFEKELAIKYDKMKEAYNKFGLLRREMDYIFELLEIANTETNQKNIADFIVSSIIMLTKVDACILRTYNEEYDSLDILSAFGLNEEWIGQGSIKYTGSLAEKANTQGKPLTIIDLISEPSYQSKALAAKSNFCSLLLIPLKFKGKLIGTLGLYTSPDKKLEIFENSFIEKYTKIIEIVVGAMFN